MKSFAAIAILAAVLGVPTLFAQSLVMESDIPFAFQVGAKVLPAGQYNLNQLTISGGWLIRDQNQANYGAFVTYRIANKDSGKYTLVFHRYGSEYFLRAFSTPQGLIGIPKSREEAHVQVRAGRPLSVVVAATFRRR